MFSSLKAVPIVGRAFDFVGSKFRLVIEYALIATVVSLAAVAVALWGSKKTTELELARTETRLTSAENRMSTLESVNEMQELTIADLKELRAKDEVALYSLLKDYRTLAESDAKVRSRLRSLEYTNENVRKLLTLPVPSDLDCLLRDACTTDQDR